MNNWIKVVSTFFLALAAAPAVAIPVQVDYSFTIGNPSGFGGFPNGTAVVGQAVYDTEAAPGGLGVPVLGGYQLLSHTVQIGASTYTPATNTLGVYNNFIVFQDQVPFTPPRDRISLGSSFNFDLGGIDIRFVSLNMEGPETIFSGSTAYVPDPSDFSLVRTGHIGFSNGAQCPNCGVSGPLTVSFTPRITPVPEPGTMALFGLGLTGLVFARRRRTA